MAFASTVAADPPRAGARVDGGGERIPPAVRHLADAALAAHDNARLPFVLLDKVGARVYVFSAGGRLQGSAPALVGLTIGDRSAADIGQRTLEQIGPDERITPAGRFVAERGMNLRGEDVIWVDYDAGLSMHRVRTTVPQERRLQRLATPTAADNRISYGCINVPAAFYDRVVAPAFASSRGIVYILPDKLSVDEVFGFSALRQVAGAGEARRNGMRQAPVSGQLR